MLSASPTKAKLTGLRLGIAPASLVRQVAVAEITASGIVQRGVPTPGGVNCLSLGSTSPNVLCTTCFEPGPCPGHFGYVPLAAPCINVESRDYLIKVLRSVCFCCSRLLVPPIVDKLPNLRLWGKLSGEDVKALQALFSVRRPKSAGQSDEDGEGPEEEPASDSSDEDEDEMGELEQGMGNAHLGENEDKEIGELGQGMANVNLDDSEHFQENVVDLDRAEVADGGGVHDDPNPDFEDEHMAPDFDAVEDYYEPEKEPKRSKAVARTSKAQLDRLMLILRSTAGLARLRPIAELSERVRVCGRDGSGCGAQQPSFKKGGNGNFILVHYGDKKLALPVSIKQGKFLSKEEQKPVLNEEIYSHTLHSLNAMAIHLVLSRIPDGDARLLGFKPEVCRPVDLLLSVLFVTPTGTRPNTENADGQENRGPSELTTKFRTIVAKNKALTKPAAEFQYHFEFLLKAKPNWPERVLFEPFYMYLQALDTHSLRQNGVHYNEHPRTKNSRTSVVAKPSVLQAGRRKGQVESTNVAVREQKMRLALRHVEFHYIRTQQEISTLFSNTARGQSKPGVQKGVPGKALRQRLTGKGGFLRSESTGKPRVKSARTVAGPDTTLHVSWSGLPEVIAKTLSFGELVTEFNIHRLTRAVRNGPYTHPGANLIIIKPGTSEEETIDLRFTDTKKIVLQLGWKVERHTVTGDPYLINRQPSLHRMNVVGKHMFVRPWTKCMNIDLATTGPTGADFDGDEFLLLLLNDFMSRSESKLMFAQHHLESPKNGIPIYKFVHDTILGPYLLTRTGNFLTPRDAIVLISKFHPYTSAPGRDPDSLCESLFESFFSEEESILSVHDLHEHLLALEEEVDRRKFLTLEERLRTEGGGLVSWSEDELSRRLQRMRDQFSGQAIFSLLLPSDLWFEFGKEDPSIISTDPQPIRVQNGRLTGVLTGASLTALIDIITRLYGTRHGANFLYNVQTLTNEYLSICGSSVSLADFRVNTEVQRSICQTAVDWVDAQGTVDPNSSTELHVHSVLDEARLRAGKKAMYDLVKRGGRNGALEIVKSGTKGDTSTIVESSVMLGQQYLDAERLQTPLPLYAPQELRKGRAQKAGFITSSYLNGLTPEEQFMCAILSRNGQVSTASNLAVIGYLERRLCKGTEGQAVFEDGTVRTASGKLISLCYGGDSFDPRYVKLTKLALLGQSEATVRSIHKCEDCTLSNEVLERLLFFRRLFVQLFVRKHEFTRDTVDGLGSLEPLANSIGKGAGDDALDQQSVWNLLQRFEGEVIAPRHRVMPVAFLATVLESFSPARLTGRSRKGLLRALERLEALHSLAVVEARTQIGTVAGQSVGEPTLQLTLKSHLSIGTYSKASQGVPRFREIINYIRTKSMDSPEMNFLVKAGQDPEVVCRAVQGTRLQEVALHHEETCRDACCVPSTDELARARLVRALGGIKDTHLFSVRIALDRETCLGKSLTPRRVCDAIRVQVFARAAPVSVNFASVCDPHWYVTVEFGAEHAVLRDVIKALQKQRCKKTGDVELDELLAEEPTDFALQALRDRILTCTVVCGSGAVLGCYPVPVAAPDAEFAEIHGLGAKNAPKRVRIHTRGTDLRFVMRNPNVDWRTCVSNSIEEIADCFGIGAATYWIAKEMNDVLTATGSQVHFRHMMTEAEEMTAHGVVLPFSRFGVMRMLDSVLARSAFEMTMPTLMAGAIAGEEDKLKGITENIITGQRVPIGTETVEVRHVEPSLYELWQLQPLIAQNTRTLQRRQLPCSEVRNEDMGAFRPIFRELRQSNKSERVQLRPEHPLPSQPVEDDWRPRTPQWGAYPFELLKLARSKEDLDFQLTLPPARTLALALVSAF